MTFQGERDEERCWPCILANSAVGLLIGWVPLAAAVLAQRPDLYVGTTMWGMIVTAYTAYRLYALGYLPHAERVARRTGLHDRIGPGRSRRDRED